VASGSPDPEVEADSAYLLPSEFTVALIFRAVSPPVSDEEDDEEYVDWVWLMDSKYIIAFSSLAFLNEFCRWFRV
jgi:hypothetical protein